MNPWSFFEIRPWIWVNDLFDKHVGGVLKKVARWKGRALDVHIYPVIDGVARDHELRRALPDMMQCDQMRVARILEKLISPQLRGEAGTLDITGKVYRLVLQDLFVEFLWNSETHQWRFYAHDTNVDANIKRRVDFVIIPQQIEV